MGVAVIEASGIDTISHLVRLTQLFGVRAYVITDMDGVHKAGSIGKRKLMEILKVKDPKPSPEVISRLHGLADAEVTTLKAALTRQADLNVELKSWDAFVLASDRPCARHHRTGGLG
ncbi:MAG: TOPRIM nucleotidyl transferase/hydrolase domain-containing protein [Phycicoccus sp.]